MEKYVFFTKDNTSQIVKKNLLSKEKLSELKARGYKKHHVEIDAESEGQAKKRFDRFNNDYLDALKGFSGNAVICALPVIILTILFLIQTG